MVHAQALQADLDTFGPHGNRNPTLAVRAEYEPKRHGFAIIITHIDPTPVMWGLLLGDIANGLQSALDQIAWALVTRGTRPPHTLTGKQQRKIYFPICAKQRRSMPAWPPSCRVSGEQTSQRCAGASRTTVAPKSGGGPPLSFWPSSTPVTSTVRFSPSGQSPSPAKPRSPTRGTAKSSSARRGPSGSLGRRRGTRICSRSEDWPKAAS